jgi:hypothetical protein
MNHVINCIRCGKEIKDLKTQSELCPKIINGIQTSHGVTMKDHMILIGSIKK